MTPGSAARTDRQRAIGWATDILAGVVIVALATAPFPSPEYRAVTPLAVAAAVAPALVVPFRRRRPLAALAATVALFGVSAFTGTLSPGAVLACAIVIFWVACATDRRTTVVVTLATIAAVVGLTVLAASWNLLDPRVLQVHLLIVASAAAGDATRSRRAYIRAVTERAERAEQTRESEARRRVTEERLRIARDLHDAVAHQITVISLNAGVASAALLARPESAEPALAAIRGAARTVLRDIGDLLEMLRTEGGDPSGRVAAGTPGLADLDALVAEFGDSGLDITVRVSGERGSVPAETGLVAYRVIQEGLANAHKHGADGHAHLLVEITEDRLRLVITNRIATRATPAAERETGGHGLMGVRERVAAAHGTVQAVARHGSHRLEAALPLAGGAPR